MPSPPKYIFISVKGYKPSVGKAINFRERSQRNLINKYDVSVKPKKPSLRTKKGFFSEVLELKFKFSSAACHKADQS